MPQAHTQSHPRDRCLSPGVRRAGTSDTHSALQGRKLACWEVPCQRSYSLKAKVEVFFLLLILADRHL